MKISKSLDYAMRSMILIGAYFPHRLDITTISEMQHIPLFYLSKIMRRLIRFGLVRSHVGPDGGYALSKAPDKIKLKDIYEAVEGHINLLECKGGIDSCILFRNCPQRLVWNKLEATVVDFLGQITLKMIISDNKSNLKLPQRSKVKRKAKIYAMRQEL
ncbi:MAG: hypothetical protein A2Y62_18005 [Candidatus Fischerbacteria bacterium RBG_13_37_8]|uniref:Rrf2 family transcriptional regulator n=1 Tax=Candidatus Fischerbacteria bacterium RBG_13_37_8 TaxID=1817863 RepID=A0A1F5VVY2_9BACT|nr:MAG: hypothetical protein A2Y62_18005 [Candidatus Fischerbacteria bacterium RBG_13_37_8]